MKIKIIYEDRELLVIDKPAGIVVNRAETVKEETIQDWRENNSKIKPACRQGRNQRSKLDKTNSEFINRAGIVHRLDKETSGILLIAKDSKTFADLQKQFQERKIAKKYLALVHGLVKPKKGKINAPVGRLPWRSERFGVFAGGKEAETEYKVIKYYKSELAAADGAESFSLLEIFPATGRTHQIRVHLKYINHPIVSDLYYGGRKRAREDRKWCPRLFLHAGRIRFKQPSKKRWIEINCPLPEDLGQTLRKLI